MVRQGPQNLPSLRAPTRRITGVNPATEPHGSPPLQRSILENSTGVVGNKERLTKHHSPELLPSSAVTWRSLPRHSCTLVVILRELG